MFRLSYCQVTGQETNSKIPRYGFSISAFGPTYIGGITFDTILPREKVGINVGVGILSVGGGIKFYLKQYHLQGANISVGITSSYSNFENGSLLLYAPVGLNFLGRNSWQWGIDAGPGILRYDIYDDNDFSYTTATRFQPFGNIYIGHRFLGRDQRARSSPVRFLWKYPFIGTLVGLPFAIIGWGWVGPLPILPPLVAGFIVSTIIYHKRLKRTR